MIKNLGLQEYLSLGYIYLLILGLITESIFYKILGINILNYSSLSDILLSPISLITGNPILTVFLLAFFGLSFLYFRFFLHKFQKRKEGEPAKTLSSGKIMLISLLMLISPFIGVEIGRGTKLKSQIEAGTTKPDHLITFNDSKTKKVRIIGQNTVYIFFVPEKEKQVIICPIGNAVFSIQKLDLP
jgi:hypothetical protein